MSELVLDVKGVSKRFGAVKALDNVQLQVHSHEVLALMGENGAGKSTLMKVLSGVYQPDAGEIRLGGQAIKVHSPADARAAGINLIYQELAVAPHMTVAQNVFMGSEPKGRFGRVDTAQMTRRTNEILASLGARFSADTLAGQLGIADQQQVEIARSLIHKSKVLIMDEPTAALSDRETERLFEVIRRLRDDGIAIVYISHRMAEMSALADRVAVMRDGGYVGTLPREEATPERVIQMMVGRPLGDFYQRREATAIGPLRLEVRNMHSERIHGASFAVHAGEVLGLAGLVGAGRTELARLVFGADKLHIGEILLDGAPITVKEPLDAIRRGIAYVPEDRKGQGLFLQLSALANTGMSVLGRHARFGILNHKGLRTLTEDAIKQLSVKVQGPDGIVGGLSGGNQQKILLARWLAIKPKVLILDEPTRGVDVGAKSEIYRIINQLAASGVAIVVISSELPEVIGICDRVVVMREGHVSGELGAGQINQEAIMTLATHAVPPALH